MHNVPQRTEVVSGTPSRRWGRRIIPGICAGLFISSLIIPIIFKFSPLQPLRFAAQPVESVRAAQVATPPDGQGVYESCRPDTMEQQCLDHLKQIATGGFSLVLNYNVLLANASQLVEYLSQAQALHMKVILALYKVEWWNGTQSPRSIYTALASSCASDTAYAPCADDTTFLNYIIHLVSPNPGLWGFYIGDEVSAANFTQLKTFTDKIKAMDNIHPRLFVAANPNDIATINTDLVTMTTKPDFPNADIATVIGQDYYPVGSYPPLPLDGTGTIGPQLKTVQTANGGSNGKVTGYAMVLQAHSFLPYPGYGCGNPQSLSLCPYPTISQMQTMLNSLLQNARPRLVLWYSYFDLLRSGNPDYHWANTITAAGFNAAKNPSFEPWSTPWVWRNSGPGSSVTGTATQQCETVASPLDSFCSAHIQVTNADPNHDWYVCFQQTGIPVVSGKKTNISFDAKSANGGTMRFVLDNATTYAKYYVQAPTLTTTWTHYSYTFDNTQFTDPNALFTFVFGAHSGDVWVNSVVITTTP